MLVQSASVAVCTEAEALMFDVRAPVDIKELKLLGDFDHPNVRNLSNFAFHFVISLI